MPLPRSPFGKVVSGIDGIKGRLTKKEEEAITSLLRET